MCWLHMESSSFLTWDDEYPTFTRLTLNESGLLQRYILNKKNTWDLMFTVPNDLCDRYGYCGPNGICRIYKSPTCECLKGFIPKSQQEWDVLDWSSGCVRSVPLDRQNGEGFVNVVQVKLLDLLEFRLNIGMSIKECEGECLKNCSCIAYANSNISGDGSGCLMWSGDLIDTRESPEDNSDRDIYIRLPASAIDSIHDSNNKKRHVKILLLSATLGILTLGTVCGCIIMKIKPKRRALNGKKESLELPLFDFTTIAATTSNFSDANTIEKGGFGLVYKGKLSTEQEIAVKRLSKGSGQGLDEFKNEVTSIAKLQHRNLVRLLGCCIQGEEKMLIYEYMCNKSLNYFIYGLCL
ncbi:G-type lectin S-receptor-like serine/threonine-protein kinase SD1-1 [Camellia sinensis]|uniref:G-type lectin S-receptor-like serine/threonine-protein kinase SD1-1 n=1 Tax=Camellia sinensis TaxID=4442 RepID=UPI0010359D6D|nr:G-type lectin S-receptor-like serine/threonine-protein kinase SD1-1 [Camellia sinensis]